MTPINRPLRAVAALTSPLLLAACGALGSSAPSTTPTTTVTVAAADQGTSSPAESSPSNGDSDATASCADTTGDEAVAAVLVDLPRPAPEMAWDASTADTSDYDPCAAISAISIVIERPTGSSPKHLLLFHHGEYVGTATPKTVSQVSEVTRVNDTEITARLGTGSGAGAPIPRPTRFRWDAARARVASAALPTPSAGRTASGTACAGGHAPEGVDSRVCSRRPSGSTALAVNPGAPFAEFASPSANIMCEVASSYVDCLMITPATRVTLDTTGPARHSLGTAPVTTFDRSTLGYGQVGTHGQFACLSEEVGVSCWSTATGHGMFLAREGTALW